MVDVSVIIPTLNEEASLSATLDSARSKCCRLEWIVVDAGSDDGTEAIAGQFGCRWISSTHPHRAHQMNLGARAALADVFLFLHADTRLPKSGIDHIRECLENQEIIGGAFVRNFESDSLILRSTSRLAAWRSRRFGVFLGDQGIFVRRDVFEFLGGFDERQSIAEDLDLSLRMRKSGKVAALEGPAISSARRFERKGPLRQSLSDFWFTARFLTGFRPASPTSRASPHA